MKIRTLRPHGIAGTAAVLFLMCGCSGHERQTTTASEPCKTVASIPYDCEKVVNVYSWADYIAPNTVANFEKETGIKVHYDVYDNNEILETKLLTGHSNYDVVVPTENVFERHLLADVYRKLDKQALPNLANADPEIMRRMAIHDPGNLYAVPYMWSTTGIGYNVDLVRARLGANIPNSWSLLFDPGNAEKLKDCGILIQDSPFDVFESAMIYLHRDPNRRDPEDVVAASEALRKIRPFVRNIEADATTQLANGDVCLVLTWSGDVELARNRAIEASTGAHIAYLIPQEGALMTVDMVAIPADAPHPHNAEVWMNYLLRPDVIAAITNYIKYPNGNLAAMPLVDASVKNDQAVYPDAETRSRLVTNSAGVSLNYTRLVTRAWTRFRRGQ
jgi:putrescine transport system substrate-binding protein